MAYSSNAAAAEYSSLHVHRTDEMRPEWFSVQKELLPPTHPFTTADHTPIATSGGDDSEVTLPHIPLKQMWADDEFWMPLMFARRFFVGRADFTNEEKMRKWWFAAAAAPAPA